MRGLLESGGTRQQPPWSSVGWQCPSPLPGIAQQVGLEFKLTGSGGYSGAEIRPDLHARLNHCSLDYGLSSTSGTCNSPPGQGSIPDARGQSNSFWCCDP